ncbi:MAG: aminoacetone oxidase family FAD-binding enzyme [Rhodovulum sulfidophilum]|uniref:Aminoacetone oxidase family FAD-binding enzyme n=1 Tax=Rhodovulum sulfidophilum TaxID=35806 RepID=A0A2W5NK79_RHOSU|nr:MAG: aminoacetone oxidase family FAD-binding enzyme [Rhodovulum sulfidophilum]
MEEIEALVIGGGPAGLMAAETLGAAGARVLLAEAKPSLGRKLLMAGKSGLNLTKEEPAADFRAAYGAGGAWLAPILAEFGPAAAMDFARGLGQPVFTGSSGRVFPEAMKASPLLRAWLGRLDGLGVVTRTRWRWSGWEAGAARFETPEGPRAVRAGVTVLALGGASWARLGSDGAWAPRLAAAGVALAPFAPSNAGWRVDWSPEMARHFGAAVKPVRLTAGAAAARGEIVVTAAGLEGGGIYALGPALRAGAPLLLDLAPDLPEATARARLARPRNGASLANHLRKTLRFPPVKVALLREWAPERLADPEALAQAVKALPARLAGPGPLDTAISTAGGIAADAVDGDLMLRALPGVFAAGEMLDWDAPTGGYLLTACLATGRHAGRAAARRLSRLAG